MKVLYCAIDQTVPGTKGGSVHVTAVAEGLAALGHDVHVLAAPGRDPFPRGGVRWIAMRPPLGARQLRWLRSSAVRRIARDLQPDAVIERYYNFGGEGILAGRHLGATTVLEVNAPVIDYPGSTKARLDRALLVEPMRRWRERLCAWSDVIVTPSGAILPAGLRADRVAVLEWGADTDRFHPGVRGDAPFTRPAATSLRSVSTTKRWLRGAWMKLRRALLTTWSVSALYCTNAPKYKIVEKAYLSRAV